MDDSLNPYCDWCRKEIKEPPAIGKTLEDESIKMFCDIICAKLYNDSINRIDFDFDRFTSYYHRTFSKLSKKMYEKCKDSLFEELPIYTPYSKIMSRSDIKQIYETLFLK